MTMIGNNAAIPCQESGDIGPGPWYNPLRENSPSKSLGQRLAWPLFMALLLVFAGWISPGISAAQSLVPVKFIPLWVPQPQFAGYYMAQEKGIYRKYGLDVTILCGGNKKNPARMLKEGKVQFALLDLLRAMELRAQGTALVNVGQILQKSSVELVVRSDSDIRSPRDFAGKSVAVWKSRLQAQTLGFFMKHKVKPKIYPVVEGIEFFLKQAVESCAVMHYNGYNALFNFGVNPEEMRVFKFSDLGMDFPEDGIYCMEDTFNADPTLVRCFVKASFEGWQYALDHPDETVNTLGGIRIKHHIRACGPHLKWMMRKMQGLIYPPDKELFMGQLLKSDYDRAAAFLIETGRINKVPAYDAFYMKGD